MSIMEQEYLKQLNEANKKIKKLIEALEFYAEQKHIITKNTDDVDEPNVLWLEGFVEDGTKAKDCLKEIEDERC